MKILFTCGGTAGHINPALAVAAAIKNKFPDVEIMFIGAEGNMECRLVPLAGYDIKTIRMSNLSRKLSLRGLRHNIGTVGNVITSLAEARRMIKEFSPDVAVGTGGYVCYPVIRAAHELHIPTVIHESNAAPGLTTRLLAEKTDVVLAGVKELENILHGHGNVTYTGTPVRDEFSRYSRETARKELGLSGDALLVLSVWGSLGAAFMNRTVLEMLPLIGNDSLYLYHCTGRRYYNEFCKNLSAGEYAEDRVRIFEYIDNMPAVMSAADLVICRAGASTLSELTGIGKPSILIPSPNVTGNHQEKNARVLERAGAAKVLEEKGLDAGTLMDAITSIVSDREKLREMAENARSLSVDNAAEKIADIVTGLI